VSRSKRLIELVVQPHLAARCLRGSAFLFYLGTKEA
jgi:hypothetical protein